MGTEEENFVCRHVTVSRVKIRSQMKIEKEISKVFNIKVGMHLESPLIPLLFITVMKEITKIVKIIWELLKTDIWYSWQDQRGNFRVNHGHQSLPVIPHIGLRRQKKIMIDIKKRCK